MDIVRENIIYHSSINLSTNRSNRYVRDEQGNFHKDDSVEFDSDEDEPPPLPPTLLVIPSSQPTTTTTENEPTSIPIPIPTTALDKEEEEDQPTREEEKEKKKIQQPTIPIAILQQALLRQTGRDSNLRKNNTSTLEEQ